MQPAKSQQNRRIPYKPSARIRPRKVTQPKAQGRLQRLRSSKVVIPFLITVVGGAGGIVITYLYQSAHDFVVAPIRVEDTHYEGQSSQSTSRSLDLAGQLATPDSGSPYTYYTKDNELLLRTDDDVRVGVIYDATAGQNPAQPEVYQKIGFTLVGQRDSPVRIVRMKARVVARRQPLDGTLAYIPPQGGSADQNVGFDLDSARLDARVLLNGSKLAEQNYLDENQVTLAKDESVSFAARVFTSACRCEFVIDAILSDGSVVTVDNNGRPWIVSGFSSHYQKSYIFDDATGKFKNCEWRIGCTYGP